MLVWMYMCYTDRERFSVSVRVWDEQCSQWLCLSRADTRRISGKAMEPEVCMCVFLTGHKRRCNLVNFYHVAVLGKKNGLAHVY